jgi:hypothetical protein
MYVASKKSKKNSIGIYLWTWRWLTIFIDLHYSSNCYHCYKVWKHDENGQQPPAIEFFIFFTGHVHFSCKIHQLSTLQSIYYDDAAYNLNYININWSDILISFSIFFFQYHNYLRPFFHWEKFTLPTIWATFFFKYFHWRKLLLLSIRVRSGFLDQ